MLLSKLKILPLDPGEKSSLPPNIITWLQPQSYELKGSDRLCKVVELSMQYPEFERKFDVQNPYFGDGYVFRIGFFKLLKKADIKCKKSSTINYRRHV